MQTFYFDTETYLIQPGCHAPPMVCISYCVDNQPENLLHARDPGLGTWLEYIIRTHMIVGKNVAFDMCVLMAQWPSLTDAVFEAYAQDRVSCVEVRQKLLDIAVGRLKGDKKLEYDLGSISLRCGGPVLDKADPWRMKYGTLYNVPVNQWPEEAKRYSLLDATATRTAHIYQSRESAFLTDEFRQARASFWLQLMTAWGIATNRASAERYQEYVQRTFVEDRELCLEMGLVRPDGTKDTKAAMAHMLKCCELGGEEAPTTETGQPSLSEEAIEEHGDEVLEAYQRYANAKTRTKRAQRLMNSPIQARFDVLKNTGRTSCSQGDTKPKKGVVQAPTAWGAQLQNVSKELGYREVFVARPGCALVSIDYDALELRTWSQVCIWLFDYSNMAEVLNAGRDPHTELAAELLRIPTEEAYKLKKIDKTFNDGPRFFSKAGNFGFLGGMGGEKFCKSLVKQAVHQGDPATIVKAKAFTVDNAVELKAAFTNKWSEAVLFFRYISDLVNQGKIVEFATETTREKRVCNIKHFVSDRVRGACYYTQACNSYFQGLAADLAKDAMWRCAVEMYNVPTSPLYGARLVNFVHDEGIFEIPLDRLHEAAYRARDIMCNTGEIWCPSLKFTAEPAAMKTWSKSAKTVFDSTGRLVPWDDA